MRSSCVRRGEDDRSTHESLVSACDQQQPLQAETDSKGGETHLLVELLLDERDLVRLDDEVAGVDVGDDELVLGRELLVAPEQDLLDARVAIDGRGRRRRASDQGGHETGVRGQGGRLSRQAGQRRTR